MAFQLKDFPSIAASIINHARATQTSLTDFNIGSAIRTLLEAPAVEIEELYQQMWNGLEESIPVSVFNAFDFAALPAKPATGMVRVQMAPSSSAQSISGGVVFTTDGAGSVSFAVVADVAVPAGSSFFDVKVVAVQPGLSGNIRIGESLSMSPAISGFVSANSLSGFDDGADAESLLERKNRFIDYVSNLSRGTVSALKYGARTAKIYDAAGLVLEQVAGVTIIEPWLTDDQQPPGLVNLYIFNGVDGASSSLVARVSEVIDGYYDANGAPVPGWKAAGVKVNVASATLTSIAVTGVVTVDPTYAQSTVLADVGSAVAGYISALNIGDDVIQSGIVAAGMGVPGVTNFRLTVPGADVVIAANAKAIAGTFNLTVA